MTQGLEGRTFPPPGVPVQLRQKGCHYDPHVLALVAGQELEVVNDDIGTILHNVHPVPKENSLIPENVGQPHGATNSWKLPNAEAPFFIRCDIHPWMGAWCVVVAHPFFAVTGEDGSFALKGLPPGEYVVEAWHEKYGTRTQTVKVGAGEKKVADFSFEGK